MSHLPPPHAAKQVWRRIVPLALLIASGLPAADPKDTHHVKAVRFWTLGDVTRIAVETDGAFQVRSDRLENPDRLFFDLVGTQPSLGEKNMTVIPVSDHLVRQIRVAETQRNVTRIVLDMEGPAVATTSRLDNPNRLIIELRAPAQSAAAAKPPLDTMVVEIVPVVEKESVPKETARKEPIELRLFNPPPPAQAEPQKAVQVAMLEPPKVASRTSNTVLASNFASKLAPTFSSSSLAAPPPLPLVPPVTSITPPTPAAVPLSIPETALPAKRNSAGGRSMIRVLGLKVGRIVLDPGHGGHDTGTVGPEGLREKDLVLDVAKRLGALIEDRLGSEVIYTRTDDTFVPLERRTEIANEAKADLFLSIHANSSTLHSVAGVETYYLNFTTSKAALEVAARENAGSQKTIYELQDLLEKIALKDKVEESREFATRIQSALFSVSAKGDPKAKDRGIRKAPFVVLIGATMPSVLSEIGFISNAHDESIMKRAEYRDRLAEALYKGLAGYANTLSHFQVAQRH
ncbi:MAG TPA: N-acetylmuramoyl-L-alanine amidase [Bryobacteraceae bacterium]|nr:N-acetylmuramoyl-L-alanine amidase [Bryobacteraceae bacterium]